MSKNAMIRAIGIRFFQTTRVLNARKNKSHSRLSIKRGIQDVQEAFKDFDVSEFKAEESQTKRTNLKAAMDQLNDPHSLDMDLIPLAKKSTIEKEVDMMTEEELEEFLLADDEDDEDDDDEEEFDRELEELDKEDNKKRVKTMLSPDRAMLALNPDANKRHQTSTKNQIPLQKAVNSRFDPEVIGYRQERNGNILQMFLQETLTTQTDLCRNSLQVWVTEVKTSPDLRSAIVFWDVARLDGTPVSKKNQNKIRHRLVGMSGWLRVRMSQHLRLRYTPRLEFRMQDNSELENRKRLDAILRSVGF
ncbi:hypothetical protein THRCLA_06428 [Thraustotheca clavata]|uniref:Ribosome-binding factor A n=1 Tax=Thraustotheca clavata TaxID=74557 RepID=A0A1V9ZNW7_9STRA|nr:hypothetical protein THRCLA_06428 [Thraustotheca clavata]